MQIKYFDMLLLSLLITKNYMHTYIYIYMIILIHRIYIYLYDYSYSQNYLKIHVLIIKKLENNIWKFPNHK